jgi:hypothetical protein
MSHDFSALVANAVLGIDTLWGGDVMSASGTGRFIADSWFSGEPLPAAYTHPAAARLRASGGVSAQALDRGAIEEYLAAVDIPGAVRGLRAEAAAAAGRRGRYLAGLAECLEVMWDLALEMLGDGPAVPYARCVQASTGAAPEPADPAGKCERVTELMAAAGYPSHTREELLAAIDAWRAEHRVALASVRILGACAIGHFDALSAAHLIPYLPEPFREVPRANIRFLPIGDAWFSGSMNYLGRARRAGGAPEYEATYEINTSLEISVAEFLQLVSHEVVPGHVTTFAYLQNLYWRGQAGFDASVPTMNTRAATLYEGIANNAILIAHGVTEVAQLPDPELQTGVLLALLQDDAKNQASYLTWAEGMPQAEVAGILRRDFLVSAERAGKLSGAWGRHPLLGRMYLPAYRAGTNRVAELRRQWPPEVVLPCLYGGLGPVDITTLEEAVEEAAGGRSAAPANFPQMNEL